MSQITHPPIQLSAQLRAHRLIALAALLALLAAAAVVLVLAIGNGASTSSTVDQAGTSSLAPVVASRGPVPNPVTIARADESAVAAAVGSQPTAVRPDESAVAAAVASQPTAVRPDESAVAAAVASQPTASVRESAWPQRWHRRTAAAGRERVAAAIGSE